MIALCTGIYGGGCLISLLAASIAPQGGGGHYAGVFFLVAGIFLLADEKGRSLEDSISSGLFGSAWLPWNGETGGEPLR